MKVTKVFPVISTAVSHNSAVISALLISHMVQTLARRDSAYVQYQGRCSLSHMVYFSERAKRKSLSSFYLLCTRLRSFFCKIPMYLSLQGYTINSYILIESLKHRGSSVLSRFFHFSQN